MVVCALFVAGSGCLGPSGPATEISFTAALSFAPLGRGTNARIDTTERIVEEADIWTVYQDSLRPIQPFKPVNFDQEMVVLAALPVPSGGYDLRFESIEIAETGATAYYRLYVPGRDCRVTVGPGVVFQAVRVARTELSFTFEREEETIRCTE